LEALFRCVDTVTNDVIEVTSFQKFLQSFLQPFEIEDPVKEDAMRQEITKMVAYITAALDINLRGFLERSEYTAIC